MRTNKNAGAGAPPAGGARASKAAPQPDLCHLAERWRKALAAFRAADQARTEVEESFIEPKPPRALRARKGDRLLNLRVPVGAVYSAEAVRRLWDLLFVIRKTQKGRPLLARVEAIIAADDVREANRCRAMARHGIWRAARRGGRAHDRLSELTNQIASRRPRDLEELRAKVAIVASAYNGRDAFFENDTVPHQILFALADDLAALEKGGKQ